MNITLDIMSAKSVESATAALNKFIEKVKRLGAELPKLLTEYGMGRAQLYYNYAAYDIYVDGTGGGTDIEVTSQPTDNGFAVVANGEKVAFVEFGAGVWYNGDGGNYLGEKPPGISGIGEYGMGYGSHKAWGFTDEAGHHVTHGTPASNSLYFTARDMVDKIVETARRILND